MKKRILMLLLTVTVLLGALTLTVSAAESGTCGENLTWTLDNKGTLTISGSGAMDDFWNAPWNSLREDILSVVVEEGVTSIGNYAFESCENLSSITLPDSLTSIGEHAFWYCTSLSSITIPDSVTNIDEGAFGGCNSLSSITLSDSLTSIPSGMFYGCDSLSNITIPEGITTIGGGAFEDCSSLSSITLPEGVTAIDGATFKDCSSLSSIILPDSLTSIGYQAFWHCTSLSSITIPEGVTAIDDQAFDSCTSLSSITLPDSLTSIGDYVFRNCESLGSITIPGNLTSIGKDAFRDCTSLSSVTIQEGITTIGEYMFPGCSSLTSITIPDSITSIGDFAFSNCTSLNSITIPDSVTSIDSYAFWGCNGLSTVHYVGTETQCTNIEIGSSNEYLTDATWHYECDGVACMSPETPPMENPFVDVPEDAYYAEPVLWAVEKGVTNGLSADTFGPDATCTRAQIVTFLWRANGSPAPTSANNPFTDVPAGQWYTDAVLWAVEKGITAGTSATTFSPDAGCTRGQVATFLWRAEGEPATNGSNIFTDIAPGAYYYNAVLWAVENSITNGMGDGTFAPDATCTRGQIVTFLYRAVA